MATINKETKVKRIINKCERTFNELQYKNCQDIANPYLMVLAWYLSNQSEEVINKLYNIENKTDFLDFVSSTSFGIINIYKGIYHIDKNNIKPIYQGIYVNPYYIYYNGILIQTHNKFLSEQSINFINYAYACLNNKLAETYGAFAISFSKVKNEEAA